MIASWERHCVSKFQDTEPISYRELVEFVERQALARDNPRYGRDEIFKEKSKDKADNTHTKNSKTRMTGNQMTYQQNTTLTTNANASHANSRDFSDSASMGSCAFCQLKKHTLKDCYSIQMTGSAAKRNFIYANNMCTHCGEHRSKDQDHQCLPSIKCRVCSSTSHITAFHPNKKNVVDRQGQHTNTSLQKPSWHGGQSDSTRTSPKSNQYSGNNNNTSDATKSTTKTGVSNKIDHISTKEQNTPMDFCHIVPARVYSLKDPSNKFRNNLSDNVSILAERDIQVDCDSADTTLQPKDDSSLCEKILRSLDREFIEGHLKGSKSFSRNEKKFLKKINNSIVLQDGHYYMKLPFISETDPVLPNNRNYTIQRLQGQQKRMKKDSKYQVDYLEYFEMMLQKGFAVKVPESELNHSKRFGHIWYIPHHGTYHPRKGKFRGVFDLPATYQGESLNQHLIQGPNLTGSIIGCLTRIRRAKVAIMCDIEQMFNQCKVYPEHQDYPRTVPG